jgi:SAM-dependent methyltransferase
MSTPDPVEPARRLAAQSLTGEDPVAWFEHLYARVEDGAAVAPWDRGGPHPLLVEWAKARALDGAGRQAVVIGAGLGEDAEFLSARGYDTVAFDVAATAVKLAGQRFPGSRVRYRVADLLDTPAEWRGTFDLVFESLTVQSMPPHLHGAATSQVGRLVAPGGTLLVVATGRDEDEGAPAPPWPLTRPEVEAFAHDGIEPVRIEELRDAEVFRWRAEFRRPGDPGPAGRGRGDDERAGRAVPDRHAGDLRAPRGARAGRPDRPRLRHPRQEAS